MVSKKTNAYIDEVPDDELFCDVCGMTYKEFLETGVFGCENCYKVFKARTVKKIKDDMKKHMPKAKTTQIKTAVVNDTKKDIKEKIEELKKLLELCLKLGEKEKAEVIKAEIKKLEEREK